MSDSQKRRPQFSLNIPEALREHLQEKAAENCRSLTGEVVYRLEQSRQQDLQPQGAPA